MYIEDLLPDDVRQKAPLQQQKTVYDTLMITVNEGCGGIFFLGAPGGTDKMYLLNVIDVTSIRAKSQIVKRRTNSSIYAQIATEFANDRWTLQKQSAMVKFEKFVQ